MVPAANRKPKKRRMSFMKVSRLAPGCGAAHSPASQPRKLPAFSWACHGCPGPRQQPRHHVLVAGFYVETEAASVAPRRTRDARGKEGVDRMHQRIRGARAPVIRHQVL